MGPKDTTDDDPHAEPIDVTPSDSGLSTTGLSAGDIEQEMPPDDEPDDE